MDMDGPQICTRIYHRISAQSVIASKRRTETHGSHKFDKLLAHRPTDNRPGGALMTRLMSTVALALALAIGAIGASTKPASANGSGVVVGIAIGAVVGGIIASEIVRRHHRRHYGYTRSHYRRY
jgi:hypothetical protein